MKKLVLIVMLLLLLTGCSAEQIFETVSDMDISPVVAQQRQLHLELPKEAAVYTVMGDEENKLYLCEGYTVAVQTMPSGDLDRTVRQISGFAKEDLSIMETRQEDVKRYDFAWSAAGEQGDQVCRGALLDDGQYHYCVTVMADSLKVGQLQEQWHALFSAISID